MTGEKILELTAYEFEDKYEIAGGSGERARKRVGVLYYVQPAEGGQ